MKVEAVIPPRCASYFTLSARSASGVGHLSCYFSMGDLLLLAITCVCRLHWSARRGSWSRPDQMGCGLHSYEVFVEN
eukprot:scaffold28733_cov75-Phaeocystis_antarctica.AAC.5